MKGTEKQVAWAQDIQKRAISALNWGINKYPDKPAFVARCEQIKAAIENVEYAGDLIAVYGDVNRDTDVLNLNLIASIVADRFNVCYDNAAQYKLIGK